MAEIQMLEDANVSSEVFDPTYESYDPNAGTVAPKPAAYKPEGSILMKGYFGPRTKALQANLIRWGFDAGTAGADGYFGSKTDAAVRAMQAFIGVSVDGKVGPQTESAINADLALGPNSKLVKHGAAISLVTPSTPPQIGPGVPVPAQNSWLMPAIIGGGLLLLLAMGKKKEGAVAGAMTDDQLEELDATLESMKPKRRGKKAKAAKKRAASNITEDDLL